MSNPTTPRKPFHAFFNNWVLTLSVLLLTFSFIFARNIYGRSKPGMYFLIGSWVVYLVAIAHSAWDDARKSRPDGKNKDSRWARVLGLMPFAAFVLATLLLLASGTAKVLSDIQTPEPPQTGIGSNPPPTRCPDCSAAYCEQLTVAWGTFATGFNSKFEQHFDKLFEAKFDNTFNTEVRADIKAEIQAYFDNPDNYISTQISHMRRCCRRRPVGVRRRPRKCECQPAVGRLSAEGGAGAGSSYQD